MKSPGNSARGYGAAARWIKRTWSGRAPAQRHSMGLSRTTSTMGELWRKNGNRTLLSGVLQTLMPPRDTLLSGGRRPPILNIRNPTCVIPTAGA